MATKKSPSPAWLPRRLARALAFLWGPGRTATALALLVAAFAVTWLVVWRGVWPQVLATGRYCVTLDQIHVTRQPPWIHSDVRGEVFRSLSVGPPLSILDDELAQRVRDAFKLHPWVAGVTTVAKHPPAQVDVELVYRRPVLMVAVAGDLLPVDPEGRRLPEGDFSPIEKNSYACLAGIDTRPMGAMGQPWGDGRVLDGAQIADAFGAAWRQLKLYRMQPSPGPAPPGGEQTYELFSQGGTRIVWGLAPSTKVLGEPPPAEKVARLLELAARQGGLDARSGPRSLDVRTLPAAKRP